MKIRIEEKSNYRSIWVDGKTIRFAIDPTKPILELEYPEFYDVKITGKCSGKCSYCLTDGIKISTIDGDKDIKNIEIGDNIFTINMNNNDLETCQVEQIHKRMYSGLLIEIELDNGNIIKITPDHEIYTINRGWIKASELHQNDILLEL